jgi:hypothetical protein
MQHSYYVFAHSKNKTQSKQWLEKYKYKQGPTKDNVSASQTKQMVLACVHNKRMKYTT